MNHFDLSFWLILGFCSFVASIIVRWLFIRGSSGSSVDHYYWILAARAYRDQSGLPVRLPGKYLLEDERQAYPPCFGLLLSAFSESFLASRYSTLIVVVLDVATLALILVAAVLLGIDPAGIVGIILVYGLAPVLVAYNTQLTSRSLGNLLLVISLLAQIGAVTTTGFSAIPLVAIGASALAAVIITHKMTTQFFIVLWPCWFFALIWQGPWGGWISGMTPLASVLLATILTGRAFQALQWRAHWDIVTFWGRNWRFLGAHQFRQSPIYGDAERRAPSAFHGEGFAGACRHAMLIAAYLPIALPLPATLVFTPAPPAFILAWFTAALLASLVTLFIPALKCLGGGHLYVFNAVPPAALWWGYAITESGLSLPVIVLFAAGLAATALSLIAGLRRRLGRAGSVDNDASALVLQLASEPATRVAAFPVTFAERIALETGHAVFWGGHGIGFRTLEPYWPVMREPVGKALRCWGVTHAILDLDWWPEGQQVFSAETGDTTPKRFGRFALFRVAS